MYLGDGNDKGGKVNGDGEWEIDVMVIQGLEDGYVSEVFVLGNSGLYEVELVQREVDDEGVDNVCYMGSIQDMVLYDKGGLYFMIVCVCGCMVDSYVVFCF